VQLAPVPADQFVEVAYAHRSIIRPHADEYSGTARLHGRRPTIYEGVPMSQVVLQMSVSLDGYVAGPGGDLDWGLQEEHPDVHAWKIASLRGVGTHIMGRATYEQMAGYWPSATGDYAHFMNSLPKVVFSRTLPAAGWAGSRVAGGELAEEIAALKSESGGEIMAHGGAAFVQALSRHGMIDEYRLVIEPVALGNGLPLFKDLAGPLRLDLTEARSFPGGTAIHVYRPVRPALRTGEPRRLLPLGPGDRVYALDAEVGESRADEGA
jgi:dihydrofolate reductase